MEILDTATSSRTKNHLQNDFRPGDWYLDVHIVWNRVLHFRNLQRWYSRRRSQCPQADHPPSSDLLLRWILIRFCVALHDPVDKRLFHWHSQTLDHLEFAFRSDRCHCSLQHSRSSLRPSWQPTLQFLFLEQTHETVFLLQVHSGSDLWFHNVLVLQMHRLHEFVQVSRVLLLPIYSSCASTVIGTKILYCTLHFLPTEFEVPKNFDRCLRISDDHSN